MGYPAEIVFSRHAESEGNALKTLEERTMFEKGTQHFALTPLGRRQAEAMRGWLCRTFPKPFDAHYVSSYIRPWDTHKIYWPDVTPTECALIDESHFGMRHYVHPDAFKTDFPQEHRRKELERDYHYRPIGGENWPDIELRVRLFLWELSRLYANKRVFVCGHAAWYTAFRRVVEGLTKEEMFDRKKNRFIANCGIRVYKGVADRWWKPWDRTRLVRVGGCDLDENLVPVPFTVA